MAFVSYGWSREGDREMRMVVKDGVWHATHYLEGEPDKYVIDMFGSFELPTPWDESTSKEIVIKEMADRNPHARVS